MSILLHKHKMRILRSDFLKCPSFHRLTEREGGRQIELFYPLNLMATAASSDQEEVKSQEPLLGLKPRPSSVACPGGRPEIWMESGCE